jgi:hypothetical protein
MTCQSQSTLVATYESHDAAELAVNELQGVGAAFTRVSIVGKCFPVEEHVLGFYAAGDRIRLWSGTAALWGASAFASIGIPNDGAKYELQVKAGK